MRRGSRINFLDLSLGFHFDVQQKRQSEYPLTFQQRNMPQTILRGDRVVLSVLQLCVLFYTKTLADEIAVTPIVQAIEYAVCLRHIGTSLPDRRMPEPQCKTMEIQTEVIFLMGWLFAVECLPGDYPQYCHK
jgi:hypothetical protein